MGHQHAGKKDEQGGASWWDAGAAMLDAVLPGVGSALGTAAGATSAGAAAANVGSKAMGVFDWMFDDDFGTHKGDPKAQGLGRYEVVPDDFAGKLKAGQLRRSDYFELLKYGFGDMDVVKAKSDDGDDLRQMDQGEFDKLAAAWLHMSKGQGMAYEGSETDVAAFKDMLASGLGDSPTMRGLITQIGNDTDDGHKIDLELGHANAIGDNFWDDSVDLDDLQAIPAAASAETPNQMTRSETILHFMAERRYAKNSPETDDEKRFELAHGNGVSYQNMYRGERGQADVLDQSMEVNPLSGSYVTTTRYAGGEEEHMVYDKDGKVTQTVPPKAKK